MIHGTSRNVGVKEMNYGELLFYRSEDVKPKLFEFNSDETHTYKFFYGASALCTKSSCYKINSDTFAVLLQRENTPF